MDKSTVGCIVLLLLFFVIAPAVFFLFWWAFNTVSPLFGGPILTFWQAFAAYIVLVIVGGFFKGSTSSS